MTRLWNENEILENPEQYVNEYQDVTLYTIDDVTVMIGKDEATKKFYITVEDTEVSHDVYPEGNQTIKDVYNNIVKQWETMKIYQYNVCFGDGRWATGTVDIEAKTEREAEEKVCDYLGTRLYKAFPELGIDYTWELYDVIGKEVK